MNDIWAELIRRIDESGESPYTIGAATGVHPTTIYRIRAGEVDPQLSTVQAIFDYLDKD